MDSITNLLSITLGAILVNNFIFSQFQACDFQGLPLFIRIGDVIKSHIRGFFRRKGVSMCQEKWFL